MDVVIREIGYKKDFSVTMNLYSKQVHGHGFILWEPIQDYPVNFEK